MKRLFFVKLLRKVVNPFNNDFGIFYCRRDDPAIKNCLKAAEPGNWVIRRGNLVRRDKNLKSHGFFNNILRHLLQNISHRRVRKSATSHTVVRDHLPNFVQGIGLKTGKFWAKDKRGGNNIRWQNPIKLEPSFSSGPPK